MAEMVSNLSKMMNTNPESDTNTSDETEMDEYASSPTADESLSANPPAIPSESGDETTAPEGVRTPEQVRGAVSTTQGMKVINDLAQQAKKLPTQEERYANLKQQFQEVDSRRDAWIDRQMNRKGKDGLSIQDHIDQTEDKLNQLEAERKSTIENTQWADIAERMGHALTQAMAGMYGLKHNINVSGLQFDRTNWEERLKTLLTDVNDRMDHAMRGQQTMQNIGAGIEKTAYTASEKEKNAIRGTEERGYAADVGANSRLHGQIISYLNRQAADNAGIIKGINKDQATVDAATVRAGAKSNSNPTQTRDIQAAQRRLDHANQIDQRELANISGVESLVGQLEQGQINKAKFAASLQHMSASGRMPQGLSEMAGQITPAGGMAGLIGKLNLDSARKLIETQKKMVNDRMAARTTSPAGSAAPTPAGTPTAPQLPPPPPNVKIINMTNPSGKTVGIPETDKDMYMKKGYTEVGR